MSVQEWALNGSGAGEETGPGLLHLPLGIWQAGHRAPGSAVSLV